jgi:hypothetical protein
MKYTLLLILFIVTIRVSYSQINAQDVIVGQWKTIDHLGDTGTVGFDKNKTMYLSTAKGEVGRGEMTLEGGKKIKTLMKYELNTKQTPMQIDFYYFVDNFYNPVGKTEGIFEILDANTIWVAMNSDRPVSIRPKDFKNRKESGIIFRANTKNKVVGCDNFRNGKFKFIDPVLGTINIERRGESQIQVSDNGEKVKFKVEWLNNCNYNLIPLETFSNGTWSRDTTGLIMNVEIVHTREKSYIYTSSYNKSNFRLNGELIKVRD